jgi:biopolymer transport protein ExbD
MNTLLAARPRKGISLTALIDVVFILLMFFMLTSSFTPWNSQKIQARSAGDPIEKASKDKEQFLLVLGNNRAAAFLDGQRQPEKTISLAINALNPDILVTLVPDREASVQQILNSIAALNQAHFQHIALGQSSAVAKSTK